MKPPRAEWRSWLYGFAWLGGGIASLVMTIWLIKLVRWGWPVDQAELQLTILGNALYGFIACNGLVVFGLTMRSAIRNFKAKTGTVSVSATSQDED